MRRGTSVRCHKVAVGLSGVERGRQAVVGEHVRPDFASDVMSGEEAKHMAEVAFFNAKE